MLTAAELAGMALEVLPEAPCRVVSHLADVAGAQAEPLAGDERRRHLPARLLGHRRHPLLTAQGRELADHQHRVRGVQP